jgi:hypothetical protein
VRVSSKATANAFEVCPEGTMQAVVCDVIDHGWVKNTWGGKGGEEIHKCTLRWQVAETMKDGRPYIAQHRYSVSLHERAALRKAVNAIRGKSLTEKEAADYELDELIGMNCLIQVVRVQKPRGLFAEVVAIMGLPRGMASIQISGGYTRVKDREKKEKADKAATAGESRPPEDEPGDAVEPPATPADNEPRFGGFEGGDEPTTDDPYS